MLHKALNNIDLFSFFMKLAYDIGEKAAAGGKDAVGHISKELFTGFGKIFRDFIGTETKLFNIA